MRIKVRIYEDKGEDIYEDKGEDMCEDKGEDIYEDKGEDIYKDKGEDLHTGRIEEIYVCDPHVATFPVCTTFLAVLSVKFCYQSIIRVPDQNYGLME